MDIAKFTSAFGGFIYFTFFICAILFASNIKTILSNNLGINSSTVFALILATAFLFAVGNFCYSYLIAQKEKYQENIDSAIFFSLQLIIIPALVFVGFIALFVSLNR